MKKQPCFVVFYGVFASSRNNKIWNDVVDASVFVFGRAKTMLQDWRSAKLIRGALSTHQQPARNVKWVKPSLGRFKCNVDASFSKVSNMVGIGMCIRDENGAFVPAKQVCFSPICEVHVGEILGLLSALD